MKTLLSSILCLALAACVADQNTTGQVSLPVTTIGSDGATYRLPPATRLGLAGNTIPYYDVSLDGDAATVTFVAAEGNYQADIYNTDQNYTTVWPLVRTMNGTTSTVDATLVTPVPLAATVVAGETTPLTFQFSITSGGTVTFGRGSVSVSIGVGQQPATSFSVAAQGGGDVVSAGVQGPYATQLAAALPGVGHPQLTISVGANVIGPWQQAGGSIDADAMLLGVCAPIQLTSLTGSGHTGFADLIGEAGHGSAPNFLFGPLSLCLLDNGDGNGQEVRIRMSREGTAETPTFTALFGSQPVLFWNVLVGTLPTRVYNSQNGTLDLDALAGTHDVPMRLVTRVGSNPSTIWYAATTEGQLSFSFVGHP